MRRPDLLRNEAEAEGYEFFDRNIRALPRDKTGKIDSSLGGFHDNDVDAFRHAYVSGVFTQEYSRTAADIFGRMNEGDPAGMYSNSVSPGSENMDLWNNSIGRKYGARAKDRKSLLKKIRQALKNGELIVDPNDKRRYEGARQDSTSRAKSVIVLKEGKTGRNEFFYDVLKKLVMTTEEFITLIEAGSYPEYAIKNLRGMPTPVSKSDSRGTNNLG